MELNTSKALAMLALGLGSFMTGMLPAWFSPRARQSSPLLLSSLLCFGGGVLLATALIHMLPEAREDLPEYSELAMCVGFFLVYFVDELVHLFYGKQIDREDFVETGRAGGSQRYGASEQTSLLHGQDNELDGRVSPCCGDTVNPRMCHVSHKEPCNKSATGRMGLLFALLLHSVLEGLAIGLQSSTAKVLLLLGAVASHKLVVGFCLGVELADSYAGRVCAHIVSIVTFSLGSVVGIGLGTALDDMAVVRQSVAMPILQALAAGTLLYVTVSEVLPRERARWHEKPNRAAGLCQFSAVAVGFAVMYALNLLLDHDDSHSHVTPSQLPTTDGGL